MMGVLFLVLWSGVFVLTVGYFWAKVVKHAKVYLLMVINCIYLIGVFWGLPRFG